MTMLHEPAAGLDADAVADRDDYVVIPRVLARSMPPAWQERFAALCYEIRAAYAEVEMPEYRVETGVWVYANEATPEQLIAAGVDVDHPYDECEHTGPCEHDDMPAVYRLDGRELDGGDLVFVPGDNPLPGRHGVVPPYGGEAYRTPPASLAVFGRSHADGTRVRTSGLVVQADVHGGKWCDLLVADGHAGVRVRILPQQFRQLTEVPAPGAYVIVDGQVLQAPGHSVFVVADAVELEK